MQAQDEAAAGFAIRARSRGVVAEDVRAALIDTRSLVLTWSLRGTRHIHRAGDVRWLLDLLGPVFAPGSPNRERQLGVAGDAGARAVRAVREALASDGPLRRSEIKNGSLGGLGLRRPEFELFADVGPDIENEVEGRGIRRGAVLGSKWIGRAPPDPKGMGSAELSQDEAVGLSSR